MSLWPLSCSISDPCLTYSRLSDAWRRTSYGEGSNCDQNLPDVWYRFAPPAGVRMPTSCVAFQHCGTSTPMWMNGRHPTASEGIVSRSVCGSLWISWLGNFQSCCVYRHTIQVRSCGSFYIYKFGRLPRCDMAFCGTGKWLELWDTKRDSYTPAKYHVADTNNFDNLSWKWKEAEQWFNQSGRKKTAASNDGRQSTD